MQNWEQHFPFATIRAPQRTAIDFILKSFEEGKRVVVLQAPVGQGKSAIAMTIASVLRAQFKKTYFLTTQKLLQDQYMRDFTAHGLRLLKSAGSYTCQLHCDDEDKKTCIDVKRLIKAKKELKPLYGDCAGTGCLYAKAKEEFFEGHLSITNYAYFLATNAHSYQKMPYRDLLILDEGHNIESAVTSFVQVSFSNKFYKKILDVKMPPMNADQDFVFKWLTTTCKKKLASLISKLKDEHEANPSSVTDEMEEHLTNLKKNMEKLKYFQSNYDAKTWVLDVSKTDMRGERIYEFKPIHVGVYVRNLLLDYAEKTLILSATVIDNEMFCEANGIKPDEVAYLELPSTFPVENRLVHVLPVGSMSRKNIDTTLPNMVEVIKDILAQHPSQKGIIHANSFKIAKYIKDNIDNDMLLLHDSSNRNDTLQYHISSPDPTILLSPSMTEGVDLTGDLSRFQIICKVPYPFLGDIIVQKRMEANERWYPFQTAKTLIQALGRSIRTETDYATSYILDADWNYFYRKNKQFFSVDFDETLRY